MAIFKFRNTETGQATALPEGEFTVGRNDDTYVHLEDSLVSRRHAKLFNQKEGLFIEDTGSGNGTLVRGASITVRTKLEVGDLVQIGSTIFRIDPEVVGEVTAPPSAGMRTSNRAYMRKDTERLPLSGEPPRVLETISREKLAAPEVNPADAEAEELNAIVIREPETPETSRLPAVRPGLTALPAQTVPRLTMPAPTPQNLNASKSKLEMEASRSAVNPALSNTVILKPSEEKASPETVEATDESSSQMPWGWRLLIFMAGMGTGLLLGLVFAKIFIEMGGKVATLP